MKRTGSEEECDEGKHQFVAKIFIEEEHAQHDPDRHQTQDGHGPFDQLQHLAKLLYIAGKLVDEGAWEAVGPEAVLASPEGDLQFDLFGLMTVFPEEVEGVLEDGGASLNAIVQP